MSEERETNVVQACRGPECSRPTRTSGLCRAHYLQKWRGSSLRPISESRSSHRSAWTTRECSFEGCVRKHSARGLCAGHASQRRKGLELTPIGSNRNRWSRTQDGYLFRQDYLTGKYIYQHREVMEISIGRPLVGTENVHHKNGVRDDNRLENLELWSTAQPRGQRIEDKVEWAVEILKMYDPQKLIGGE
jgi:hypothetical protein